MSLSPENEEIIRRAVWDRLLTIENIGIVLPVPIFFNEKADYLAQISALAPTTKKSIETARVKFCAFYPISLSSLVYEIYLFSESDGERKGEAEEADAFIKKLLKRHSDFVSGGLEIVSEFEKPQTIDGLADFVVKKTAAVEQNEYIENRGICELITRQEIKGYSAKFQLKVNLLQKEC